MREAMNATIIKFGYPNTLIRDYRSWVVLLRPKQATLGALILAAKAEAEAFADLPQEAFGELKQAVGDCETALRRVNRYSKINYLMLMMVDPHVHFHVLPRYDGARTFSGVRFEDKGWPGPPALGDAPELTDETLAALREAVKAAWPR